MRTRRIRDIAPLLDPFDAGWGGIAEAAVPTIPTPLAMQPTDYIRNKWNGKAYGADPALRVAAAHDGLRWAIRAEWSGVSGAGHDFPDALALALPVRGDPPLALMGADGAPIHFLRWQANKKGVSSQLARGIGTSGPGPALDCSARAQARGARWHLVIARPLGGDGDVAPLVPGASSRIGFAVWVGGNDERAGIKAFSIDWLALALDA